MKKVLKSSLIAAAVLGAAGAAIPMLVSAWGDNSGGDMRPSYTIADINNGVLGDKIVFNSISDGPEGDEKNFVSAREDTGINAYENNVWNGNKIEAENGKTYLIRLFVHNNNPKGEKAIAKDVTTNFSIPTNSAKEVAVEGFIKSSNATPSEYWDYIKFTANSNFHLEYVYGSAGLRNKGIGNEKAVQLDDNIVNKSGVKIGYSALDGNIPGCYQYASYVTIKVKVVYDQPGDYLVEKQVRNVGGDKWGETVNAKIGDEVEYRIHYKNTTASATENVMVKDVLPKNMEYVKGTTVLYNATNPNGIARDDTITTTGVNIGGYAVNGDGYVIFRAKVVDRELGCGSNKLVNYGQVGINKTTLQDTANVMVEKTCANYDFETAKTVRKVGDKDWKESVDIKVGDKVEYKIEYKNTGNTAEKGVVIKDKLPENMKYVKGSTKLYNDSEKGKTLGDEITTSGVAIGDYEAGKSAYVVFTAEAVDTNLVCGNNNVTNWGSATVDGKTLEDSANAKISKDCPAPTPTPKEDTPSVIPTTGPAEFVSGIIGAGALTVSAGYYVASRKELKNRK